MIQVFMNKRTGDLGIAMRLKRVMPADFIDEKIVVSFNDPDTMFYGVKVSEDGPWTLLPENFIAFNKAVEFIGDF